jgi:hypothetical protein
MTTNNLPSNVINTPGVTNSLAGYFAQHDQGLKFCATLVKSKLVPATFQTPEAVYVALLWGQELGFSPIQAVNSIQVIQGTPSLPAATIKALIVSWGGTITIDRWDSEICTVTVTRAGWEPMTVSYEYKEAEAAGLAQKDNWKKNRKDMLFARAISRAGRNMYADKLKGFYATEEMRDAVDVTPQKSIARLVKPADTYVEPVAPEQPTLQERVEGMIKAFSTIARKDGSVAKVSARQLSEFLQKNLNECTEEDVENLTGVYKAIKGGAPVTEFFLEDLGEENS